MNGFGSQIDDFLEEEGLLAEAEAAATKRVIAWQIESMMTSEGLSKSEMARRMGTSRSALNRLLDPSNSSVTLLTIERAAKALGKKVHLEFWDILFDGRCEHFFVDFRFATCGRHHLNYPVISWKEPSRRGSSENPRFWIRQSPEQAGQVVNPLQNGFRVAVRAGSFWPPPRPRPSSRPGLFPRPARRSRGFGVMRCAQVMQTGRFLTEPPAGVV